MLVEVFIKSAYSFERTDPLVVLVCCILDFRICIVALVTRLSKSIAFNRLSKSTDKKYLTKSHWANYIKAIFRFIEAEDGQPA